MKHGSLFSGIGGFDLAAEWMGWENVFHCEWNEFGQKVLNHYWPNAISYEDITKTDFTIHRGKLDILTGGFPCQDASIAKQNGGERGIQGSRTGLVVEMLRAIEEIQPRYVVAENVANLLQINKGQDFNFILNQLARMGYNAEWRICRASEKGAPHHRARLYLVAYSNRIRIKPGKTFIPYVSEKASPKPWRAFGTVVSIIRSGWWDSEPPILCVDDGVSRTLVKKSLQGYGNAVVPQIPFEIFKAIDQYEN